jgi:hypothetical protein
VPAGFVVFFADRDQRRQMLLALVVALAVYANENGSWPLLLHLAPQKSADCSPDGLPG